MATSVPILERHPLVQTLASMFASLPHVGLYLVGGVVRNALLHRPFKDIDVVITGLPLPEVERRLQEFGQVARAGKRFAVLTVRLPNASTFDVALPRVDDSFGTGRYRDVNVRFDPELPIEQDLARRDLTINAMAWNVMTREVIDPFNGQNDLAAHTLRFVGNPFDRIQEDATRILRAIRFAAQLDFSIEPNSSTAISEKLFLLQDESITPREVIGRELVRAFHAAPARTLDLLDRLGVLKIILPELNAMHGCGQPDIFHAEGDVWNHTRLALESLSDESFRETFHVLPSPQLVIAVLLHDVGKPPTQKTPERDGTDRIRFDRHAPVGAAIAGDICTRLKLSSTGEVNCDELIWLLIHHLDNLNLEKMKLTTIEKTFLQPPARGLLLQQLSWADARASLNPDEAAAGQKFHELKRYRLLQERLEEIKKRGYQQGHVVPLLTGDEIMQALGIPPGPDVGRYLEALRSAQLSGKVKTRDEALAFVQQYHGD